MPIYHTEKAFEATIEESLLSSDGYARGDSGPFDLERALFPGDILSFIQETQPKEWMYLEGLQKDKAVEALAADERAKDHGILANRLLAQSKGTAMAALSPVCVFHLKSRRAAKEVVSRRSFASLVRQAKPDSPCNVKGSCHGTCSFAM